MNWIFSDNNLLPMDWYISNHNNKYQKVVKKTDITPNVLNALKLDEERKINLIDNNVNFLLRGFFKKFSGVQGSRIN